MYSTTLFDYHLPNEKIAQHPMEPRDGARMLIIAKEKEEGKGKQWNIFREQIFRDITSLLRPGDLLVINNTRVMPARIGGKIFLKAQSTIGTPPRFAVSKRRGLGGVDNTQKNPQSSAIETEGALDSSFKKEPGMKEVECLFLRNTGENIWEMMCFPGERLKVGREITLENGMVLEVVGETYAGRLVRVPVPHHEWLEVLRQYGEIPLPPYITEHLANSELYQTVYASELGSTASPTAGRHFTPELLDRIRAMGVDIAEITLHIGPGTFKPIYEENIEDYRIHSEYVTIPASTIEKICSTKKRGGRIIAVGTTSVRSLESLALGMLTKMKNEENEDNEENGGLFGMDNEKWIMKNEKNGIGKNGSNWLNLLNKKTGLSGYPLPREINGIGDYAGFTDLYITPGFDFQLVDVMITNFHAPRTSLLVLVASFMGLEQMKSAYEYALDHDFRFLSFGDVMWVERGR